MLTWQNTFYTMQKKRDALFLYTLQVEVGSFSRENDNLNIFFVMRTEVLKNHSFFSIPVMHMDKDRWVYYCSVCSLTFIGMYSSLLNTKERGVLLTVFINTEKRTHTQLSVKMAVSAFAALSGTLFLRSRKFRHFAIKKNIVADNTKISLCWLVCMVSSTFR